LSFRTQSPQDIIPPHTGLIEFLISVVQKRKFGSELIRELLKKPNWNYIITG
jgi:hypothetical protein